MNEVLSDCVVLHKAEWGCAYAGLVDGSDCVALHKAEWGCAYVGLVDGSDCVALHKAEWGCAYAGKESNVAVAASRFSLLLIVHLA